MKKHLYRHGTRFTHQSQAIPGSKQVPNTAGGYAYKISDWDLLKRFLILGTEGGTYYISERKLTADACAATIRCIKEDGKRVVSEILDISHKGRAANNDYAIFALAMCAGTGDKETRRAAFEALPKVCRIGTHLFHFAAFAEQFRGWGRGMRHAVSNWYNSKSPEALAYQLVKYQQRDGWSHRDLLRLSHARPVDETHNKLFSYAVSGITIPRDSVDKTYVPDDVPAIINGAERIKECKDAKEAAEMIVPYSLPRECVPTELLKESAIWDALLQDMPLTAMIRNLGNMSKVGLLVNGKWDVIEQVCNRLTDVEIVHKARVHPIQILAALVTYSSGKGFRGRGSWETVGDVIDALNKAFYLAFDNVEPSGKTICVGIDVSGSMHNEQIVGLSMLSCHQAAAVMSMATYRSEKRVGTMLFDTTCHDIGMSRDDRLDSLVRRISSIAGGGTDCALPMKWALQENFKGVVYDAFVIYTDSETWAGYGHPQQWLDEYRRKVNPDAVAVIVSMACNQFSVGDPEDAGVLQVVGFDTGTPNAISEFLKGF